MRVRPTRYTAAGGAIVGHNQGRLFNRPLYIANTNAFLLTGDRPVIRFASACSIHGTFLIGLARGDRTCWLHEMADITLEYRPAHARWVVRDPSFPRRVAQIDGFALGDEVGFAIRARVDGAQKGDRLVWTYGGAATWPGPEVNLNWLLDPYCDAPTSRAPFDPSLCQGNAVRVRGKSFTLAPAAAPEQPTCGRCSAGRVNRGDSGASGPLILGNVGFADQADVSWSFSRDAMRSGDPSERVAAGLARSAALASVIVVETPEPRLDALAAATGAALDGLWYPPVFRHGAMLWNRPYPGWRTIFGGTAAGWHERVKAEALHYFAHQVRANRKTSAKADPKLLLTGPARDSRFYGRGRITQDQGIYNMQSQFFDQIIHAWRWTGDAALESRLRPALELHLEWIDACFDPDQDGLYESVINTWPTDSVWCSGGGATEETSYAFAAHRAARELALRAGDARAAARHGRILARIGRAFRGKLWIEEKGHAGLYREQGYRGRLHEDAWLYSIFLPIDAGLVSGDRAAASLHYTENVLENVPMPFGGRQVWTSNFVPAIWSVRPLWPGDNYHLALAYFKTGLARDGWEIFRGNFLDTAFDKRVPGDCGAAIGGTDFGDCVHMFARTLVEGLFGYTPDYPAGKVVIAPQFPDSWDRARLRTSDIGLQYTRRKGSVILAVDLARPAKLDIRIPICAAGIKAVTVDGQPVPWIALPAQGGTLVHVSLPSTGRTVVAVSMRSRSRAVAPVVVEGRSGDRVSLRAQRARVSSYSDPQGALVQASLRKGVIAGQLGARPGFYTIAAVVTFGSLPQTRLFRIRISERRMPRPRRTPLAKGRVAWNCVDLGGVLNGDVRTIYRQRYLSPRPETVSIRIGTDGFSPWTFVYWNAGPPTIDLGQAPALRDKADSKLLRTPQGVPFFWPDAGANIAFTSRWKNWPRRISVTVSQAGEAVWFLVCGSTNPMQCRIANAVLRLHYADRVVDNLELVPPVNFWNLCPIGAHTGLEGQENREDYPSKVDAFCLPPVLPQTVQLGNNCRAMLLEKTLRRGIVLDRVTLETLSPEVVVGLMGITVLKSRRASG